MESPISSKSGYDHTRLSIHCFVGLLSIKGLLAGAADSAVAKGAKFLIGSFVPVVGGAVSDALGSIVSSLSLVRGATGAFGILAVLLIALPVLPSCFCG